MLHRVPRMPALEAQLHDRVERGVEQLEILRGGLRLHGQLHLEGFHGVHGRTPLLTSRAVLLDDLFPALPEDSVCPPDVHERVDGPFEVARLVRG